MNNRFTNYFWPLPILIAMFWVSTAFSAQANEDLSLLDKNGCVQCHRISPDSPLDQRQGPDLFFAGNKFQTPWLINWLQQPMAIRLSGFITDAGFLKGEPTIATPHPKLEQESAKAIAEILAKLTIEGLEKAPSDELQEPLSKGKRFKFKILFEREYGCISCHQSVNLAGQPRGGVSGPTMLDAGDRLKADWVYQWLKNPENFEKRGRMPRFEFNEDELKALTQYVMWHKKSKGKQK